MENGSGVVGGQGRFCLPEWLSSLRGGELGQLSGVVLTQVGVVGAAAAPALEIDGGVRKPSPGWVEPLFLYQLSPTQTHTHTQTQY